MMAPYVYEAARRKAPIHIQMSLGSWNIRDDHARISGRVVTIFRGRFQGIWHARKIELWVPVISDTDDRCLSGKISHDWSRFADARWVECFLERGRDGAFELILSQIAPIRRPTWRPVCHDGIKGFICPGNLHG